eukprot:COSAG03_NODE_56_length_15957_cov_538.173225_6_plen_71_part_00
MWRHLAGIIPASAGFVNTTIMPRVHDKFGPRGVSGEVSARIHHYLIIFILANHCFADYCISVLHTVFILA